MNVRKFRWSKVYESSEEELNDLLHEKNFEATCMTAEAFAESEIQNFSADATLWCAEGSFGVRIGAKNISMQPGDALFIPADTPFTTLAGISGFIYYRS